MVEPDSSKEPSPQEEAWVDLMPGRLPTGRRSYGPGDIGSALELLLEYSHQDRFGEELGRGLDLLWEAAEPDLAQDEQEELEALADEVGITEAWLLVDFALADQWSLLDHFLMERGDTLEVGQRNFLLDLRETHLSLFEVREVVPGKGFVGTDLWSGDRFRISCPDLWPHLVRWDLLVGRLLCRPDGSVMFEFGTYPFPAGSSVEIRDRLRQHNDWLLSYEPNLSARTFMKRIGFLFHHLVIEFREGRRPSFLFPESSLITLRVYRCRDPEAAALLLEQAMDSFLGIRRYHWLFKSHAGRSTQVDPEAPQVRIRGRCLEAAGLEVMDLERLEERLSDLLPHSLEMLEQRRMTIEALREIESGQLEAASGTLAAVHGNLRSQLDAWLHTAQPEFKGLSPLDCSGDGEFMPSVLDQLKAFENRESRKPMHAKARYDFGWVWERLGSRDERA